MEEPDPTRDAHADPPEVPAAAASGPAWSEGAVLYQVQVASFTEEGTFEAAAGHLPRLRELGVDVVWLMPIHPQAERVVPEAEAKAGVELPVRRWEPAPFRSAYAVRDHRAIDPALGDEADLRAFCDGAHRLGLKVMLGWVPAHTSWDNPLLAEHPGWYARNPEGRVLPQKTWLDIAKLDYEGPEADALRAYMREAREKFVALGVDAFREDIAGWLPAEHWEKLRAEMDPDGRLLWLAEADEPWLHPSFDLTYDWPMHAAYWRSAVGGVGGDAIDALVREQAAALPPGARRMRHLLNHDLVGSSTEHWPERFALAELFGDPPPTQLERWGRFVEAFTALNFTLPRGVPMVLVGEEIGHFGGINRTPGGRCPFPWDAPPDPGRAAWIAQLAAARSRLAPLRTGSYRRVRTGDPGVYAFERALGGQRVSVVVNLSGSAAGAAAPEDAQPVAARGLSGGQLQPGGVLISATARAAHP